MRRLKTLIFLGIVSVLVPLIGVPISYKQTFAIISGIIISIIAISLQRARIRFLSSIKKPLQKNPNKILDSFEGTPEGKVEDTQEINISSE